MKGSKGTSTKDGHTVTQRHTVDRGAGNGPRQVQGPGKPLYAPQGGPTKGKNR